VYGIAATASTSAGETVLEAAKRGTTLYLDLTRRRERRKRGQILT